MAKLTPKQKIFCDEYLKDLNATRAYKASYKNIKNDGTAAAASARMLRNVKIKDYIDKRMKDREKRTEITQDKVLNELATIAFSNGAKYARVVEKIARNEEGQPILNSETGEPLKYKTVDLTLTDELTEEEKKAISSIKHGKNGIEVSSYDKVKALELIGRHLGMFKDRLEVDNVAELEKSKKIDNIESILDQMKPPKDGDN